jgi:hypothetical protein
MTTIKVHAFWPDGTALDWNGQPGCAHCPLPRDNPIHDVPEPEGDVSGRVLGEHEEQDE